MINWLYKTLMNKKSIGPELTETQCQIDGCTKPAADQWFPSTCALREAGVKVDWVAVCLEHDIQANEKTVRHFFGDKYDSELETYRKSREAKAGWSA